MLGVEGAVNNRAANLTQNVAHGRLRETPGGTNENHFWVFDSHLHRSLARMDRLCPPPEDVLETVTSEKRKPRTCDLYICSGFINSS